MRIVMGGASGLVGRRLAAFLGAQGDDVRRLVRRAPPAGDEIAWDPDGDALDAAALEDCHAVVHLGGESIAAGRWTPARKQRILRSRVASTQLISRTLAGLRRPPSVFICASAIGIYGPRGDEALTEEDAAGTGFLADVCRAWEAATAPAASAGIRVVNARLGVVLSREGGALASMLPVFRLGLGGVLGSGRQVLSWIALDDAVSAIHFAIKNDTLRGPVNLTAPQPVTNREFTRSLGRVLRRPTILPAPAFAVRAALGEMGRSLLLEGQRVLPKKLLEAGFRFTRPTLEPALQAFLS